MTDPKCGVETAKHGPEPDVEFRLYVVLHGLICLVDDGDSFVAYLPEMGADHEYLYGDWLVEADIPPRAPGQLPFSAELRGVNSGEAILDPDQNAVGEIEALSEYSYDEIRGEIGLPRPRCIHHFLCGDVDSKKTFNRVNEFVGGKPPTKVCGIRVFEYTFRSTVDANGDEINHVRLEGADGTYIWTCPDLACVIIDKKTGTSLGPCERECLEKTRTVKVAVLHIFNEPGYDLKGGAARHNIDEFNKTTQFLGMNTQLENPTTILGEDPVLPAGLLEGEIDPLSSRHDTVLQLLLAARTGDPAEGVGGSSGSVCNGCNATVKPT